MNFSSGGRNEPSFIMDIALGTVSSKRKAEPDFDVVATAEFLIDDKRKNEPEFAVVKSDEILHIDESAGKEPSFSVVQPQNIVIDKTGAEKHQENKLSSSAETPFIVAIVILLIALIAVSYYAFMKASNERLGTETSRQAIAEIGQGLQSKENPVTVQTPGKTESVGNSKRTNQPKGV